MREPSSFKKFWMNQLKENGRENKKKKSDTQFTMLKTGVWSFNQEYNPTKRNSIVYLFNKIAKFEQNGRTKEGRPNPLCLRAKTTKYKAPTRSTIQPNPIQLASYEY